tara:strand:- start:8812 stop:9249 length:438 start_codon:yes stop_codon:yes gene_type:complete
VKYEYNVKKGDIILTDVGSAVLMRQTRAKWFYLFRNKMISVRKSDFWEYVDLGKIRISYVKAAKYRTKQRKMRTLDLRGENASEEQVKRFLKFEKFIKPPYNIAFNYSTDLDTEYFINIVESLDLEYEIERRPSGPAMFRVFSYD